MEQSRSGQTAPKAKGSPKEDPAAKAKDTIAQIAIFANVITLFIYEFFGQGEEVEVGIGISKKIYYTAGYDDIGFWLLGSVIISFVALTVIGILNKK